MQGKIIEIEETKGPFQFIFQRVLRMVPDRDRKDKKLQRLIAFRLRIDGENATREYLMLKIREMIQSTYKGPLFDFLKEDLSYTGNLIEGSDPPDIA